jgi:hypothetical protein
VDQYIAAAPLFAQPLLVHWRAVVRETCPAAVETLKWSRPHFLYQDKLLCGMSAFKGHCAIGFWHGEVVPPGTSDPAMGQFGRLYTLADLPPLPQQRALIRQAMTLIEQGVPPARLTRRTRADTPQPLHELPEDLRLALDQQAQARAHFQAFAPSQRREYLSWLAEAKKPETRARRLAQALEWLAEGKHRNWKYER